MNYKVIELEDKKEYLIIDEKKLGQFTYLLLRSVDDKNDICIRKRVIKDKTSYLVMLADEKELQTAMKLFV